MPQYFVKDADEVLDYVWDFKAETNGNPEATGDWLQDGDSIVSSTVTADTGLTVDESEIVTVGTRVRARISGGTLGSRYGVLCQATTAEGQIAERTIRIEIRER